MPDAVSSESEHFTKTAILILTFCISYVLVFATMFIISMCTTCVLFSALFDNFYQRIL